MSSRNVCGVKQSSLLAALISKIVPYRISVVLFTPLACIELMDAQVTPNEIMARLQARLHAETQQREKRITTAGQHERS